MFILRIFLGSNVKNYCSDTEMSDQNFVAIHFIPEKTIDVLRSLNHAELFPSVAFLAFNLEPKIVTFILSSAMKTIIHKTSYEESWRMTVP